METKLNMRNSLHRKKILIALDARKKKEEGGNNQTNGKGNYMKLNLERLDHQWVVRWLDDVGLPQYKDRFLEARVDGRVLNLLSVDDVLVGLRISNQLHHLSIKRGIQVNFFVIALNYAFMYYYKTIKLKGDFHIYPGHLGLTFM